MVFWERHFHPLELLSRHTGWGQRRMSPNVPPHLADSLSSHIQQETNLRVRQYGDVYHTLTRQVVGFAAPRVRQLEIRDVDLLADFRSDPHRLGFKTFEDLLANGVAAGAVVDGRLVSLAQTNAVTPNYGDIGVYTDESWRGRGFATAAASMVASRVQALGLTPVGAQARTMKPHCIWPPNSVSLRCRDGSISTFCRPMCWHRPNLNQCPSSTSLA